MTAVTQHARVTPRARASSGGSVLRAVRVNATKEVLELQQLNTLKLAVLESREKKVKRNSLPSSLFCFVIEIEVKDDDNNRNISSSFGAVGDLHFPLYGTKCFILRVYCYGRSTKHTNIHIHYRGLWRCVATKTVVCTTWNVEGTAIRRLPGPPTFWMNQRPF